MGGGGGEHNPVLTNLYRGRAKHNFTLKSDSVIKHHCKHSIYRAMGMGFNRMKFVYSII